NVVAPKFNVIRSQSVQAWMQKRAPGLSRKQASIHEEGFLRLLWTTIDYDGNNYIDCDELQLIVAGMRLSFYSVFYFGETSDFVYKDPNVKKEVKMLGFSSRIPLFLRNSSAIAGKGDGLAALVKQAGGG
ncbi:unnamed protein product, partial [Amoebophrya sp. A25]